MPNENEGSKKSFKGIIQDHPLRIIAAVVVATIFLCFLVFESMYEARLVNRDEKIASLKEDINTLETERDSLRRATKNDFMELSSLRKDQDVLAETILCSGKAVEIVGGEIIITLTKVSHGGDPLKDFAKFLISDTITKSTHQFIAGLWHNSFDFKHRKNDYVLLFLGFEYRKEWVCAKISVRKRK